MDPATDSIDADALLKRARGGDDIAESLLFSRLQARILPLAKKKIWDPVAAEDVAQETIRTALEKYRAADLQHGIFPWLFTILHHKVGNYLTRRRREVERFGVGSGNDISASPAFLVSGEQSMVDLVHSLDKALQRLSGDCRRIFRLLLEGATREEIRADFGDEPMGTIDSRISRCRARLLCELEGTPGAEASGR